jgi:hypothetical protein
MRFALRRPAFVLTLRAALTLNFLLLRMMPGDPAIAMMATFHGRLTGQALKALEVIFAVNSYQSLASQTELSEFPLRILMQRTVSPFVISNAVRHVAEHWYPSSGWARSPSLYSWHAVSKRGSPAPRRWTSQHGRTTCSR